MRTWLFRLTAVALLLGLPPALQTERAVACSCTLGSPVEGMDDAAAVFAGKLVDTHTDSEDVVYSSVATYFRFDVSRVWKGEPYAVVILKEYGSPCGASFEVGEEYLVYAYENPPEFAAQGEYLSPGDACSWTRQLVYAQEALDALGPGQLPDPGTMTPRSGDAYPPAPSDAGTGMLSEPQSPGGWAIALLAAAAVALAGLGFAAVRRRARDG